MRDETKMGAEFSRRALLSLLLSERLSIFNLSCVLPIGLRATRRRVIGRLALCVPHRLSLLPSLCSDTLLQCREGCCCHLPGKYSSSTLKSTGVNERDVDVSVKHVRWFYPPPPPKVTTKGDHFDHILFPCRVK